MIVNFNGMLFALSYALDCVESELVGAVSGHSKRVAFLCARMGRELGLTEDELVDLTACAALHDNALTQYIADEQGMFATHQMVVMNENSLGLHCIYGEENISDFPFETDVKGAVLYHHENIDGSGPFGKKQASTPLFAQLIHFADKLDVAWNLGEMTEEKYNEVISYLQKNEGTVFAKEHIALFQQLFPYEYTKTLNHDELQNLFYEVIPVRRKDYNTRTLVEITRIFAQIIDYKSPFTKNHSLGIAGKAKKMGEFYGFDEDKNNCLYVAGALHDIGKLAIHNDVLEKPDKLTDKEYQYMKNHAWQTWRMLKEIDGFEEITHWASCHHEKLNGSGYPFGKVAKELGKEDRLLACLDIYQALTEKRPYKDGMSHEATMSILDKMAADGLLDSQICGDISNCFA